MPKLPGSIRQRGKNGSWQVRLRINGQLHEFGPKEDPILRHGERPQVEAWLWDKCRELMTQEKEAATSPTTTTITAKRVSELIAKWRELELWDLSQGGREAYEDSLKPITRFFVEMKADPMIDAVSTAMVKEFLKWRSTAVVRRPAAKKPRKDKRYANSKPKRQLSRHTVAKDYRGLRRLFQFGVECEWLDRNVVKLVSQPKADKRVPHILSQEEYQKLLEACDDEILRLFVLTCGESGARSMSEVLHLRWEDVDLNEGYIHIAGREDHRTKAGREHWSPMTPELVTAMRDHFALYRLATYRGKRSPWVFHHPITNRRRRAGERISSLYHRVVTALKRAGLPRIHVHDLRHRRATTWIEQGHNIVHIQHAMGHANVQTTMGYLHMTKQPLRSLVEKPEREQLRALAEGGKQA